MSKNNKDEKCSKLSIKQKLAITFSSIFAFFAVIITVAYFLVGHYAFAFALNSEVKDNGRAPVEVAEDVTDFEIQYPDTNRDWFKEVDINVKNIYSDDGYKLYGYEILNMVASDKWLISVHGYRGSAIEQGLYAEAFYNEGYNILLPDLEGHGNSQGKYVGMGYYDRFDILKWINLVIEENPKAQIVLHGVSMGGATVLMTTGENLPINVKVAISDCAYSNVEEEFLYLVDEYFDLPFKNFIMSAANVMSKIRIGVDFKQINIVDAVEKSKTPTLFIHGTEDKFVPFYMLDKLYNANNLIQKQKLIVNDAHHAMSATVETELYFETVFTFVDNYID